MTVGTYQQLYQIAKSSDSDIEKSIQSVCVITGKTAMEVEDMPIGEFKSLSNSIITEYSKALENASPKSFLRSDKSLFQVEFIPSNIRSGQYTELQEWLRGDLIDNLHLILASISFPVKKYLWVKLPNKNDSKSHKDIAEKMKEVDFVDAYGCVVFFCKLFSVSIRATLDYLESKKKVMTKENYNRLRLVLTSVLGGYTTPREWQTSVELD